MNTKIPEDLMLHVERNLKKHVEEKKRKKHIYKIAAAILSLAVFLPLSTYAFAQYNNNIFYKQEIDLARQNKNITEVNQSFKYKNVQFTIKEILADETGMEVIYNTSDPKYSINEIIFGDKDSNDFRKDLGYIWGQSLPNLHYDTNEKAFFIYMNDAAVRYMKENPVTIKIKNLAFNTKQKSDSLLDKVDSLLYPNTDLNVDWTLKMQIPLQQVKTIPIDKEFAFDIGTLKIHSLKVSILKSILEYSFVPKDKSITDAHPYFSMKLGQEYTIDQGTSESYDDSSKITSGTQEFHSIYYNKVDPIAIKLIGIETHYRFSDPSYKIDKNKIPMEFDCNGEKFKVTSMVQKGSSTEYTIECNKDNRSFSELEITFPENPGKSHRKVNRENIKFKDQASRDAVYNALLRKIPNLSEIEKHFSDFKQGMVSSTLSTNSSSNEFEVAAVKNIPYDGEEIIIRR